MTTAALAVLLLCAAPAKSDAKLNAKVDTVVVCPQEFRLALEPWLKHRRDQGHVFAIVSNMKSADELRAEIRRTAGEGNLKFVVLVGDADPAMDKNPAVRRRSIPTHHSQAVVNVKFKSEPEIATDNWYADLNDDRVPDVAVGRMTCDTPAELKRLVDKILAYENSVDYGTWRRQVNFVAGLGGFGPVADTVLEAAAKSLISEGIPSAYCTSMTYGSWQSPYCPDPRQFRDITLGRLNEGSLFWVYIGHGHERAVDNVRVPGGKFPILTTADVNRLTCEHGAPIACFLACYSGAFDQSRDCLAEEMLRTKGGPVAILCGSRVTMPYAMSVMGSELLQQCFREQPETLGEAFLEAKRRMVHTDNPSKHRTALDAIAKAISPTASELEAERAEHLDLFNLVGDPLLRVPYPNAITVETPPNAIAGKSITISGESPLAGRGVVELAVRRDRLTFKPPRRGQFDPQGLDAYAEVYRKANEPRLITREVDLSKGAFSTTLDVPADARGACHVRVFLEGKQGCACGAADLRIDAPETK